VNRGGSLHKDMLWSDHSLHRLAPSPHFYTAFLSFPSEVLARSWPWGLTAKREEEAQKSARLLRVLPLLQSACANII